MEYGVCQLYLALHRLVNTNAKSKYNMRCARSVLDAATLLRSLRRCAGRPGVPRGSLPGELFVGGGGGGGLGGRGVPEPELLLVHLAAGRRGLSLPAQHQPGHDSHLPGLAPLLHRDPRGLQRGPRQRLARVLHRAQLQRAVHHRVRGRRGEAAPLSLPLLLPGEPLQHWQRGTLVVNIAHLAASRCHGSRFLRATVGLASRSGSQALRVNVQSATRVTSKKKEAISFFVCLLRMLFELR
ncbi:unnamed protein product [Ixodes persulcatus]